MRFFSFVVLGFVGIVAVNADFKCDYSLPAVTRVWIQMTDPCMKSIRQLICKKMNNAIQYLALGAYYLQDCVNRPGYANLFIKTAYSDRDTAIDLIDYLNMRGQNSQGQLIQLPLNYVPPTTKWATLTDATDFVLKLEAGTTNLFHTAIGVCEKQSFNDYNVVNMLARDFLHDQYDLEKHFADRDSSLRKLFKEHKSLGEFIADTALHRAILEDEENDDEDD